MTTKYNWAVIRAAAAMALAAGAASEAYGQITVTLNNQTFTGFNFNSAVDYTQFNVVGTLTSVSINVTLNAAEAYTYADDLSVYVDIEPLSSAGFLQVGGKSNLFATEPYSWPNGGSSVAGTTSIGTVNIITPLVFTGNKAVDGTVWIGNGYGATGTSGTWTGTVTLNGVNAVPITPVPEPTPWAAAVALAGLGGYLTVKRRQNRIQAGHLPST